MQEALALLVFPFKSSATGVPKVPEIFGVLPCPKTPPKSGFTVRGGLPLRLGTEGSVLDEDSMPGNTGAVERDGMEGLEDLEGLISEANRVFEKRHIQRIAIFV